MPTLRETLTAGLSFGGWLGIPSGFTAELMGEVGYDWLCVDTQHGLAGQESMLAMLQGARASGTPAVVRVPWNEPAPIMRALDAGAGGVIVPMVSTGAEARAAAAACRYAPDGIRSYGPTRAALVRPGFGPEQANADVVCLVMVETAEGLANLDEIVTVPGVDGIFVGPNDLAISRGFGRPPVAAGDYEAHEAGLAAVAAACRARGLIAGAMAYADVEASVARWRGYGFSMFALNTDHRLLADAARSFLARARAAG